jgi:branched-chain amino acid transport system ATP-binding protein
MKALLQGKNVFKYFGKLKAISNLNFNVFSGEILGIAGPNGAGKTTLFNVITHIPYSLSSGQIIFEGRSIHKFRPYQIFRMGIARTFQIPTMIRNLSVLENVLVGATFGQSSGDPRQKSIEALDFVGLHEKKDSSAEHLSLFERKQLMLASAFVLNPKLLLLDEPLGGLTKAETEEHLRLIRIMNEKGITVVVIEHKMDALVSVSKRMIILHHGEKIGEGPPAEVIEDEKVIETYLGEKIKL